MHKSHWLFTIAWIQIRFVFELQIEFCKCHFSCLYAFPCLISVRLVHGFTFISCVCSACNCTAVKFISHTFANFEINYSISAAVLFLHVAHIGNDVTDQLAEMWKISFSLSLYLLLSRSTVLCVCPFYWYFQLLWLPPALPLWLLRTLCVFTKSNM